MPVKAGGLARVLTCASAQRPHNRHFLRQNVLASPIACRKPAAADQAGRQLRVRGIEGVGTSSDPLNQGN
jgi:hypothetical protein